MTQNATSAGLDSPSSAIRNETLVLTLPDAVNPVVWQFDLSSVRASAIEVQAHEGLNLLRLKTPRGEVHDIAAYVDRDRAVAVLSIIHRTLAGDGASNTNSRALVTSDTNAAPVSVGAAKGNWPLAVCAVIVLVLCLYLGTLMRPPPLPGPAPAATPTAETIGVPQSADDVLRGRAP